MSTVRFRFDYAKFMIICPGDLWSSWYRELNREAHECKFAGEWLKSHKVNRLRFNRDNGMETWTVDIWGEWTGIVHKLPVNWLPCLRRADVRAIVWDADEDTVVSIGQHLQKVITSHNVNVYATKKASKRLGRDRGGKGFAIGSHKSDLRVTCYKRTGEPVAQEFQAQGAILRKAVQRVLQMYGRTAGTTDLWVGLKHEIEEVGNARLARVFEAANIGTAWPILGPAAIPQMPPAQHAFLPEASEMYTPED